jgi:hypothetical protein
MRGMQIVVDLVGLCYYVCSNSLADFLPLVLEPSMGHDSGLFKISHLAGRDPNRRRRTCMTRAKHHTKGIAGRASGKT